MTLLVLQLTAPIPVVHVDLSQYSQELYVHEYPPTVLLATIFMNKIFRLERGEPIMQQCHLTLPPVIRSEYLLI